MSNGETPCVVDTNVVLVANQASDDASPDCIQTCARRLGEICRGGHVVVDDLGRIFNEYRNKTLKNNKQRGAGDEFVLWMISNLWNAARCTQVKLTPKPDDNQDFNEFPDHPGLENFDRSDRVFVAVANAHKAHPPILAACDTDHWNFRESLQECGIPIVFLCEADVRRLAERKANG